MACRTVRRSGRSLQSHTARAAHSPGKKSSKVKEDAVSKAMAALQSLAQPRKKERVRRHKGFADPVPASPDLLVESFHQPELAHEGFAAQSAEQLVAVPEEPEPLSAVVIQVPYMGPEVFLGPPQEIGVDGAGEGGKKTAPRNPVRSTFTVIAGPGKPVYLDKDILVETLVTSFHCHHQQRDLLKAVVLQNPDIFKLTWSQTGSDWRVQLLFNDDTVKAKDSQTLQAVANSNDTLQAKDRQALPVVANSNSLDEHEASEGRIQEIVKTIKDLPTGILVCNLGDQLGWNRRKEGRLQAFLQKRPGLFLITQPSTEYARVYAVIGVTPSPQSLIEEPNAGAVVAKQRAPTANRLNPFLSTLAGLGETAGHASRKLDTADLFSRFTKKMEEEQERTRKIAAGELVEEEEFEREEEEDSDEDSSDEEEFNSEEKIEGEPAEECRKEEEPQAHQVQAKLDRASIRQFIEEEKAEWRAAIRRKSEAAKRLKATKRWLRKCSKKTSSSRRRKT